MALTTRPTSVRACIKPRRAQAVQAVAQSTVPTPPRSIHDVSNGNILGYGEDLAEDHPGFLDAAYKRRRADIARVAAQHKIGERIPEVTYLPEEHATWHTALSSLKQCHPRLACKEYLKAVREFNFSEHELPQLQDVHERLQATTGWSVRPVAGLMHPRDFLNGLAFRTFHSTQYVRHASQPMYTPEPDLVHEIIGHVPMLTQPDFCALVEAIGVASLSATDKQIWHLVKLYWFTVEFGVVRQDGEPKAFGAGILSSYGELEHLGAGRASIVPLDPWQRLPKMQYNLGYQEEYFALESFNAGAEMLRRFCKEFVSRDV